MGHLPTLSDQSMWYHVIFKILKVLKLVAATLDVRGQYLAVTSHLFPHIPLGHHAPITLFPP
jgi:hypothetical protein